MKKFYALVMAAMMCTTASFAQMALPKAKSLKGLEYNAQLFEQAKKLDKNRSAKVRKPSADILAAKAPKKTIDADKFDPSTLITEAPAGIEVPQAKYGYYYYSFWGYVFQGECAGDAGTIIYGNDGCIYLKNPFTAITTDTYLKFEKEDEEGSYVAHLPQAVYHQDEGDGYEELTAYAVCKEWYEYEDDGETYEWVRDMEDQDFRIKIEGDSVVFADPEVLLAMGSEDDGWYGYGDYNMRFGEFTDEVEAVPDGIEDTALDFTISNIDFYLTDEDGNYTSRNGHVCKCAIDPATGKAYAKGVFASMPDAWVIGTYDGEKAVFPSGQYIGVNESYGAYAYFVAATTVVEDDGEYYVLADDLTFDVDLTTMTMTTDRHAVLNSNKDTSISYMEALYDPELKPYAASTAAPQDPAFTGASGFMDDYGYGYFYLYMPIFDVEGNLMEADKLFYNIFLDDEKMTLYSDEYTGLDYDELTDIPFSYTDSYYDIYASGTYHWFYYYTSGFDKFGVMLVNMVDGDFKASNIVYYDMNDGTISTADGSAYLAIESATKDSEATVKSVSYTDISGRQVSKPANGLFIKTMKMSDGSMKSVKVIK